MPRLLVAQTKIKEELPQIFVMSPNYVSLKICIMAGIGGKYTTK